MMLKIMHSLTLMQFDALLPPPLEESDPVNLSSSSEKEMAPDRSSMMIAFHQLLLDRMVRTRSTQKSPTAAIDSPSFLLYLEWLRSMPSLFPVLPAIAPANPSSVAEISDRPSSLLAFEQTLRQEFLTQTSQLPKEERGRLQQRLKIQSQYAGLSSPRILPLACAILWGEEMMLLIHLSPSSSSLSSGDKKKRMDVLTESLYHQRYPDIPLWTIEQSNLKSFNMRQIVSRHIIEVVLTALKECGYLAI